MGRSLEQIVENITTASDTSRSLPQVADVSRRVRWCSWLQSPASSRVNSQAGRLRLTYAGNNKMARDSTPCSVCFNEKTAATQVNRQRQRRYPLFATTTIGWSGGRRANASASFLLCKIMKPAGNGARTTGVPSQKAWPCRLGRHRGSRNFPVGNRARKLRDDTTIFFHGLLKNLILNYST